MNLIKSILAVLIGLSINSLTNAQPQAYMADYNRMMRNIDFNMTQHMLSTYYLHGLDYAVNNKYDFKVTMKDGTVKNVESKIYADTVAHANYLLAVDKAFKKGDPRREQKIYASQTLQITRTRFIPFAKSDYRANQFKKVNDTSPVTGSATDSCWHFKVVTGKISAYSYLSEIDLINTYYLSAIQFDSNPVEKLTPEALEKYIKDDEKAYKAFLKKDYYDAITIYNRRHQ